MVSEDSPADSNSSILHQFSISNSISDQNQFANQHYDAYGTASVSNIPYPQSLPLSIQCLGERNSKSVDLHTSRLSDESDVSHRTRLMDLLGTSNDQAQRLSLSLGSVSCRQIDTGYLNTAIDRMITDNYSFVRNGFSPSSGSQNESCSISHGTESFSAVVGISKYLKPAQSLLEEMVGVGGKDIDANNQKYVENLSHGSLKGSFRLASEIKAEFFSNELLSEKHGTFVSLLKLLALLDEVDRRYEEYYHHMEELVSSFEVIAGLGAGKSYTALALQAMSNHFCSLRKAILSQIRVSKRKIEKDMPSISARLSQLSLFNQEPRHHQTPVQQIIQNSRQAWRPIRGLPENSVMILRAWLFEHFLHPYPNESEKLMLASQTGLSKNQISNWFINARVRLWKPMIEEMYKEEFADSSTESDQVLTSCCTTREGAGDSAEELS
ncbi:BEL1-like homeodomain protein 11 [Primulina tabacum]|uniref:BEL1-like homeodomain protein 11 n=1 Tax=Primulina tabacum TaxID=48773 RepID=UPI003F5AC611